MGLQADVGSAGRWGRVEGLRVAWWEVEENGK